MPAPAMPARKSGGGAGLIIGLGLVGLLGIVVLAGGGWYFFLRKPAAQVADVTPTPGPITPSDVATPVPTPVGTPVTTATPTPAIPTPPPVVAQTPLPTTRPTPTQRDPGPSRPGTNPGGLPTHDPVPEVDSGGPGRKTAGASFLDAEPEDSVDGRAAGEDLAGKYRSGQGNVGASTGATGRFRPRDRSPRALIPVERPAVATIRHIINAEEAYHRKRNRYGSLSDMASAQSLFLDVAFQPTAFRRLGYNFELTVESDGFKVVGMPISPNGRPFIGDDSGIIRAGTE